MVRRSAQFKRGDLLPSGANLGGLSGQGQYRNPERRSSRRRSILCSSAPRSPEPSARRRSVCAGCAAGGGGRRARIPASPSDGRARSARPMARHRGSGGHGRAGVGRVRSAPRFTAGARGPLIGYVTVRSDAGSSYAVRPWAAIEAPCERFGWNLLEIVNDRDSGRIRQRPGLRYALGRIVEREADGLVISDLHLLSRSIVDVGALLAWFRDAHATLIALDLNIDTSTPEGDHVASTLIALANSRARADRQPDARPGQGLAGTRRQRPPGGQRPARPPWSASRRCAPRRCPSRRSPTSSTPRACRRCAAGRSGGRRASRRRPATADPGRRDRRPSLNAGGNDPGAPTPSPRDGARGLGCTGHRRGAGAR